MQTKRIGDMIEVEGVQIPKSTYYDLIELLEKGGLIYEEGGKYYYKWRKEKEELLKEFQEFKNWEEFQVKLNHSKILVKEVVKKSQIGRYHVNHDEDTNSIEINAEVALANSDFMEHLGYYPDVKIKINEMNGLKCKRDESERDFEKAVKLEVEKRKFSVVNTPEDLGEGGRQVEINSLLDLVRGYIGRNKPPEIKASVEVEYVMIAGRGISKYKGADDVESLVMDLISSEELKGSYKAYQDAVDNYFKKVSEVEGMLRVIARKTYHGEPLKGLCRGCPKVFIARGH